MIPGVGYAPNRHDALTGSQADGRAFAAGEDRTCRNWTSSTQGAAMLGHIDRKDLLDDPPSHSWNSSHPSRGTAAAAKPICAAPVVTGYSIALRLSRANRQASGPAAST
jgi:hypothetical protein